MQIFEIYFHLRGTYLNKIITLIINSATNKVKNIQLNSPEKYKTYCQCHLRILIGLLNDKSKQMIGTQQRFEVWTEAIPYSSQDAERWAEYVTTSAKEETFRHVSWCMKGVQIDKTHDQDTKSYLLLKWSTQFWTAGSSSKFYQSRKSLPTSILQYKKYVHHSSWAVKRSRPRTISKCLAKRIEKEDARL